ncbi:DUF2306 domain-containing protein [Spirosoma agri]|uniref:DUF2306 domain-containing protein n=1 Tax=Spirosoma agri TaxID=1987381 RepID=A0A6M0IMK7_9BACT|nr:hypothetical protein [Spirosoma agri]NEU69560.1 hypothetical protein [Spirosoma agri]
MLAALTAISTGTYILFTTKGTSAHRLAGRFYAVSMGLLLCTAFQMYYLSGCFGIVHWGAVGSGIDLLVGLGALGLKALSRSWLTWHYLGMGASITGLYAAFFVESTYRFFPEIYYWWVTLGLAALVFLVGSFLLYHHYPGWIRAIRYTSG